MIESIKTKIKRKLVTGILLCTIAASAIGHTSIIAVTGYAAQNETVSSTEESDGGDQPTSFSSMTDKQLSSISMLNHMTVLSQEINASSNSRLYLDNAYSDIVNNINPNAVDEDSLNQIKVLLNTIYAYQSIETKRERLKYIYEQNQAKALQQAVPNPILVHAVVSGKTPIQALFAISYMAYDAGWKIKAKDNATGKTSDLKVYKANGGFVSFVAPVGDYSYEMTYNTPYLNISYLGSALAFTGFFTTMLGYYLYHEKKKNHFLDKIYREN